MGGAGFRKNVFAAFFEFEKMEGAKKFKLEESRRRRGWRTGKRAVRAGPLVQSRRNSQWAFCRRVSSGGRAAARPTTAAARPGDRISSTG